MSSTNATAIAKADRFRPTSVLWAEDDSGIADFASPQIFEAAAQAHPVTGNQVLFSRCRTTPFNAISKYSSFTGNVIKNEDFSEYSDGTKCGSPQNEQNIVVNPTDPNNIVVSANDYRFGFGACWAYVTKNAGTTWSNVKLPGWTSETNSKGVYSKTGCGGDPVLAFDSQGTLYFTSLTYGSAKNSKGKAYLNMSGLAVASSTDGGLHWSNPSMIDYQATSNVFNDKEWIAVAPDGTVYVTWTQFNSDHKNGYVSSPIVFSKSRNGGRTWSPVRPVSDAAHPYNQGSQVGITLSGVLVVAYEGSAANYETDQLIVAQSRDGGSTFTNTEVARIYDDYSCYPLQEVGAQGRQTLSYEQFRINSFPSMAIDPTTGKVAIVWSDNRGSGNCGANDPTFVGTTSNQVYLSSANDSAVGLLSFNGALKVTSGPADKVFPSVGANAGKIVVGYYTREYSPSATADQRACGIMEAIVNPISGSLDLVNLVSPQNPARAGAAVCLDYEMVSSVGSFLIKTRLTEQSANPYIQFAGSFIGDYTGAAVDRNGKPWFVWTDFRGNPGTVSPNQDTVVRGVNP
jgi:hypothetical protein